MSKPSLSFAGFRFHGLNGGKFPISVWFGAWGTSMKFTNFPDRSTTSHTRHSQHLLQGEFLGFHNHILQHSAAGRCSIVLILQYVHQAADTSTGSRCVSQYDQN
jgi:hypothetical protein